MQLTNNGVEILPTKIQEAVIGAGWKIDSETHLSTYFLPEIVSV